MSLIDATDVDYYRNRCTPFDVSVLMALWKGLEAACHDLATVFIVVPPCHGVHDTVVTSPRHVPAPWYYHEGFHGTSTTIGAMNVHSSLVTVIYSE